MGQLQRAMLDAFNLQDLESLLLFRLDRRLDQIASSSGNLSTATLEVIQAANREGWIADLLRAVGDERPNLATLQTLVAELLTHVESTPAAGAPAASAPSVGDSGRSTTTTSPPPGKPTVVISYSHQDEAWKDKLATQLTVLQKLGLLDPWDDRRIGAGLDWRPAMQAAMDRAAVAVLLISADYLSSDFIMGEEAPRLMQRRAEEGLRVIPLVVRPCPWRRVPWLSPIQPRPADGRPLSSAGEAQAEEELAALAEEIAAIIEEA
jgi:hypothetical protein